MPQDHRIGLVFATMIEAGPFIQGLSLTGTMEKPFEVYENDRISLIISGIGKANASMACTYLITARTPSLICNLGAAGATTDRYRLGQCLHVHKIIEPDRPGLITGKPHEHQTVMLDGFETAVLATQDRPVITGVERDMIAPAADLVDMEAASIAQVCRRMAVPCYIFKFISDTPGTAQIVSIVDTITRLGGAFYQFFHDRVQGLLHEAAGL
ncbi:MAG TPA: hypothetical protein PLM29_03275 [Deltaproteobacteria bacterium]|nr:hypothetical protein [Deltaproteobacteria bacterium]